MTTVMMILVVLAGFVQGVLGFGFALVFTTLMMVLYPSSMVVPLALMLGFLINSIVFVYYRRWVKYSDIFVLLLASLPGIGLAIYFEKFIALAYLKIVIGCVLILSVIVLATGMRVVIINRWMSHSVAGLFSGALGTLTSMGGPPLALFYLVNNSAKDVFKANIVCFFLISGFIINASLICTGRSTLMYVVDYWYLFLLVGMGSYGGVFVSRFLDQKKFEKWVCLFLLIIGFVLLFS